MIIPILTQYWKESILEKKILFSWFLGISLSFF